MLNGLDLFSGIGGISSALKKYIRPIAYCESDRYAQAVLLSRMQDGALTTAPIWDDVRTLPAEQLPPVDIIYGGFPCQDISTAGRGAGLEGERSGLFLHIIRLAKEIRPAFIFLENVPAIRTRGLGVVLRELSSIGYDARWTTVSAEEVGAPHRRNRWFLLAHAKGIAERKQSRRRLRSGGEGSTIPKPNGGEGHVANSPGERLGEEGRFRPDESTQWIAGSGEALAHSGSARLPQCGFPGGVSTPPSSGTPASTERGGQASVADPMCIGRLESRPGRTLWKRKLEIGRSGWWSVEPDVGRVAHGIPNRVDRIKCLGNGVVPEQVTAAFEILIGNKKRGKK